MIMKYKLKTFGITRDILGDKEVSIEVSGNSVSDLRAHLHTHYPKISSLNSLFIAINNNYASDDTILKESDEIALIPPVSGG